MQPALPAREEDRPTPHLPASRPPLQPGPWVPPLGRGFVLVSLGVDVVEVDRIAGALRRFGERFLHRIFTPAELGRCLRRRPGQREACLAGRFAAKEAVMKALGTGRIGVSWAEIEVGSRRGGGPLVVLRGRAEGRARVLGLHQVEVSITHGRDVAVAVALGLRELPSGLTPSLPDKPPGGSSPP